MRAVYSCGESHDSNPIVASLDTRRSGGGGGVNQEGGEEIVQTSTNKKKACVGEEQSKDIVHESGGTIGSDVGKAILDGSSESGVWGAIEHAPAAAAGKGGECAVGETEAQLQPGFLPSDSHHGISGPQMGTPLSCSTLSDQPNTPPTAGLGDHNDSRIGGALDSPSLPTTMSQQTCSEAEMDHLQSNAEEGSGGESSAQQVPPDFDGTNLFRLVPKAHHITDETVSVMSNFTEEYLGGSSSRDTMSHERSLTSMIFGACETGGSTSDSSSSDGGGGSESGDTESNSVDHNNGIVEIQKSYLVQQPPQSSHARSSWEGKEEKAELQETEVVDKLTCIQATDMPRESHDRVTRQSVTSEVSTLNGVTGGDSGLPAWSHPPSTPGLTLPHPSPLLFDGVLGTSSKHIPPPLHRLSDVQLHGGVQGLPVASTTARTFEPDSLTAMFGSAPQVDAYSPARNKAEAHLKEAQFEKIPAVTTSDLAPLLSCGTVKEKSEWVLLNYSPLLGDECQVSGEQSEDVRPITITSGSFGRQTTPEAFQRVTGTTHLNLQPLLSSGVQTVVPSELADTSVQTSGIPEGAGEATAVCEKNVKEKPLTTPSVDIDSSSATEGCKEKGVSNEGMNNKSNFESPVARGGVTVVLPNQLAENFDQLQASKKLPNAANNSNLLSRAKESRTNESATCTENGASLTSTELANKPQTFEQQSYSAAANEVGSVNEGTVNTETARNNRSASSVKLASLLLSQLESDLNAV